VKIEIDISSQLKELLNRNNVQAHSVDRLDASLRSEYLEGRRKALVFYRSKLFERSITFPDNDMVGVNDSELSPHLKNGERVLLVLDSGAGIRYVLQTTVAEIFADRFVVRILDPRHDQRFSMGRAADLTLSAMAANICLQLQSDTTVIERTVSGPITMKAADLQAGELPDSQSMVEDVLLDRASRQALMDSKLVAGLAAVKGIGVVDISLGGACLAVAKGSAKGLDGQLLSVCFALPSENAGIYGAGLGIAAFAVVRGWKQAPDADHLHLMFISRLPELLGGFFSS
jgi:hypothetical protein